MNRGYLLEGAIGYGAEYLCASDENVMKTFASDLSAYSGPMVLPAITPVIRKSGKGDIYFAWDTRWRFSDSLSLTTHHGYTITFWALQMAFHLGWRSTIILGMDHRFNNSSASSDQSVVSTKQDENHFDPGYFPVGTRINSPVPIANEYSYALARAAFEGAGREVVDATPGGACRVFVRKELSELI